MNINSLNTSNLPSKKELFDFWDSIIKSKKEKEKNRKELMQRQLKNIIGDKNIIISNNSK